jgi:hypothetical protein
MPTIKFGRIIILSMTLFGSGVFAAMVFALVYVAPIQYVTVAILVFPVVGFLSVFLGGGIYSVLLMRKISITLSKCVLFGILLGAIPGFFLWATSQSPSADWSATQELAEAAWSPVIFGVFGAIGGLAFAGLSKVFRLR